MMDWLSTYWVVLCAAVIGGGGTALLGTYVVGLRMPFISIVISHSAMLGAVLGMLLGLPAYPLGFAVSLTGAFFLGQLIGIRGDQRAGKGLDYSSILFSLMIGLTFLGIAFVKNDRSPFFSLLWGNLLFVNKYDLLIMLFGTMCLVLCGIFFHKEIKAVLFSRKLAMVSGIRVKFITSLFMVLAAMLITANLRIVGGLLIYSLLTCPAAAAFLLAGKLRTVLIISSLLGIISSVGGFLISYQADLPTGSCITLCAVFVFGASWIWRRCRQTE